jgi:colicin import membrane protein
MKDLMDGQVLTPPGAETPPRTLVLTIAVSFVGHVLFFLVVLLAPVEAPRRDFAPATLNVSLVNLPRRPSAPASPAPAPGKPEVSVRPPEPQRTPSLERQFPMAEEVVAVPEPKPEKVPDPLPVPEKVEPLPQETPPEVSVASEPKKPKKSLKRETFKPSESIQSALSQIEKKVETAPPPDPLKETLKKLEKRVERAEAAGTPGGSGASSVSTPGPAGAKASGGDGQAALTQITIYQAEIPFHIQRHWAYSEQMAGGQKDLAAWIIIKIMPNGEIADIWFEKKSGNTYLDESAFKAVKKSSPLPPLPKGYNKPFMDLGLRFTPLGLEQGR